jgi:tetratricopeptide (TPR) repeat protein
MHGQPTELQLARLTAGWSKMQLIGRMRRLAPAVLGKDFHLPDNDSLKTSLRRWENGYITPGTEYRKLLRAIYNMTDEELGFPLVVPHDQITAPPPFSAEGLAYFDGLLAEHFRADNLVGPHRVLELVKLQTHQLNIAARDARGPLRHDLITAASRYHEFLGWLHQDCGRSAEAMAATDRARDLALELRDPLWDAYLLMRKSNIATDAHDAATAVTLADVALENIPPTPHRLRAVVLRQKANAHAALGESDECDAAVDAGFADVSHDATEGDQLASYCTTPYVAMEAIDCWTQLGQPSRALDVLDQIDNAWPAELRRDNGLSLARIATAQAAVGDRDPACKRGHKAVTIADVTRSARTIRALCRLRRELDVRWRDDPEVETICAAIASLVSSA